MRTLPAAFALALASCTLAGCTVASGAEPSKTPTVDATDTVADGEPPPAWRVDGGGEFVQGTIDLCDLSTSILIEDFDAITDSTGEVPITSMSFIDGSFIYSTIWPDEIVGTGVASWDGTYRITYDASGAPLTLEGQAVVRWHDEATDAFTEKPDTVRLTFTEIPRPEYCP